MFLVNSNLLQYYGAALEISYRPRPILITEATASIQIVSDIGIIFSEITVPQGEASFSIFWEDPIVLSNSPA